MPTQLVQSPAPGPEQVLQERLHMPQAPVVESAYMPAGQDALQRPSTVRKKPVLHAVQAVGEVPRLQVPHDEWQTFPTEVSAKV